jgi:hypothetical protein
MNSLIVIIMLIFFAAELAFGRGARTIRTSSEIIDTITKSWAGLASLLFLFLLIAQFIAYFNFSNIAQVLAVKLGDVLERLNIGAAPRVRLVAIDRTGIEHATAWATTMPGATLMTGVATSGDRSVLLLDGSDISLEIALPEGMDAAAQAQLPGRNCAL